MATTQRDSSNFPSINREPLFFTGESNQFLFDNGAEIEVQDMHPLFDIPIMETYEAFCQELRSVNAHRTFENDYDGIEVLCFKAEQALSNLLSMSQFEERSVDEATVTVTGSSRFHSFTDFTSTWFESFVTAYNNLLHTETPGEFEELRIAAQTVAEKTDLDADMVVKTIAADLDVDVSDCL